MESIKKIAGKILLYFYFLQRIDYRDINNINIRFNIWNRSDNQDILEKRDSTIFNIDKFNSYTNNDLYNAIVYLHDSGLISYYDSEDNCGISMISFKVTASGIDLIEGIERGETEKKEFNIIFNFNITQDITVESLLKAEFGPLIKNSLL
jgi:hypothetical protein